MKLLLVLLLLLLLVLGVAVYFHESKDLIIILKEIQPHYLKGVFIE